MKSEIITIGDEILIGQIVDTNAAYLGEKLSLIGVEVHQITSIQDTEIHIAQALEEALGRVDVVIITGGLGPTNDDVTKKTLCAFFGDKLVHDEPTWKHIKNLFHLHFNKEPKDVHKLQALVPSKATVLKNNFGTAPGMWFEITNKVVVSLPGVPREMKGLIENEVLPRIQESFNLNAIVHHTIVVYDIGESDLAERIRNWENALPKQLKLAYLPSYGLVRLRISGKGANKKNVQQQIEAVVSNLHSLLEGLTYTNNGEGRIENVLQSVCSKKKISIATAESFTGGQIAQTITSVPGASTFFKGSVVSYATETKIEVLGVPKQLIELHSVVSAAVVEAMASQVRKLFKTEYAIATTGNAGPTKGDSDAEIGTVFIAISTPKQVYSRKFNFGKSRDRVVSKGVNKALEMIIKEISNF